MATLEVLDARGGVVQSITLDRERFVIGRGHGADVILDDPSVSRRHAMVLVTDKGVLIMKLEATNGIWARGQYVEQLFPVDGEQFQLGNVALRFVDPRMAPTMALPRMDAPAAAIAPTLPASALAGDAAQVPPQTPSPFTETTDLPTVPTKKGCWVLLILAVMVAAAGGVGAYWWMYLRPADGPEVPPPVAPVAEPGAPDGSLPDGLELAPDAGHLFEVDVTTPTVELPVHGQTSATLAGVLADGSGRREIVFAAGPDAEPETVFAADWHLPAVAALGTGDEVLVCANRLTGATSALTGGDLPDPRNGVGLACRSRTTAGWRDEAVLAGVDAVAAWLVDIAPRADGGFDVTYARDATGILVAAPEPGDGIFSVAVRDGAFAPPELVQALDAPMRPLPDAGP